MTSSTRGSLRGKMAPVTIVFWIQVLVSGVRADDFAALLPDGVKTVWTLSKSHREKTPTRERICINGLWRWQPAGPGPEQTPVGNWGFFKVPGCWPGITDFMQRDSQTLYRHPSWKNSALSSLTTAWYEREITIPREWMGRRVALSTEYLNSFAVVFVDGKKAGEIRFPAGELDLTSVCRPGGTHLLSMYVVALPLKAVMNSYTDTASARQVKGTVPRRGLCGDVYLIGEPAGTRIKDVSVETSVRKGQITCRAALQGLAANERYSLNARVVQDGRTVAQFASQQVLPEDAAGWPHHLHG